MARLYTTLPPTLDMAISAAATEGGPRCKRVLSLATACTRTHPKRLTQQTLTAFWQCQPPGGRHRQLYDLFGATPFHWRFI